ncbi:MAG: RDD family protein [Crenarchaeota archaeon]|jgi:uncharacterized RDD family membrane protein YckC|nr:RDD family protein [Thermoproteota archaeon]
MANTNQIDWTNWIYRLIAYIIDSIIIGIPAYIIYFLLIIPFATIDYGFGFTAVAWWASLLLPFVLGILQLIYFVILDVSWGATIGKRLMKLEVQSVNGGKITFDKAFIRNISKIYGLLLLLDWLIGIISTGNKNQKFLDRSAGALVTRIGEPFASAPPPPPPPPPPTA